MVRVPGFLREGAVAGEEEIWSIVAGCGPHLVFKTAELSSLVVSSLSLEVFKQRSLSELLWGGDSCTGYEFGSF